MLNKNRRPCVSSHAQWWRFLFKCEGHILHTYLNYFSLKSAVFFWGKHGWLVGINSVIKSYKSKARFILTLSTKIPGLVLLCCSQLACILIYFTTIFFTNRWTVGFKIISYELQWLLDLFINLCVCAKQGRYNKNTVLFKCGQPASLRLR